MCQALAPGGGSLLALTVPMATDIAFAMGILGFFRSAMPLSASAFLLTLATVDDLGAILVLATCFASHVVPGFLAAAAAVFVSLGVLGRAGSSDLRLFGAGGAGLWYCLLRSGVNSDVAGVLAAMCISTRAMVKLPSGKPERLTERAIRRLSPFTALGVMPLFALANTAVRLGGPVAATGLSASAAAAAAAAAATASAASVTPAVGIAAGLLIGKPLGIFGFTWLADRFGLAKLPTGMNLKHLGVVGMLGGIGFTMCLLLTEVAITGPTQALPKLAVLISSAAAAVIAAVAMKLLPEVGAADDDAAAAPAA